MKNLKESCRTLGCAQQGNSAVVILIVVALVAAGVLGFMAGKNKVPGAMGDVQPPSSGEGFFKSGDMASVGQPNPVVARVDSNDIKRQEVIDLINAMPPQMRQVSPEQLYPMALEQAIGNRLADSKAALSCLESDPEVQKQLWQAKQQIIRSNFIGKTVSARVTEESIKAEYDNYVENFPAIEEVRVAHILVDDEKVAKDLIKKLDNGANFADLAKENSKDGSAERGGELGFFAKNEVVPEFAEAAFATEIGTYAKQPVKSEFGYHIVRVDEKRIRPPSAYDRIKPFIKQELERKELQAMLDEWKSGSDIERFDIDGNPMETAEVSQTQDESGEGVAVTEPEAGDVESAEPAAGDDASASSDAAASADADVSVEDTSADSDQDASSSAE